MIRLCAALIAPLALLCAAPASAQVQAYIDSATRKVTSVETDRPLPTIGKQETLQLAAGNTPAAAVVVVGGDYIFTQVCATYGTVNLQVLGPDGVTYQTIVSKTAADTAGGTGLALGSNAIVRVTVSGTSDCAASLSRVPA